jgi:hypothetical protein
MDSTGHNPMLSILRPTLGTPLSGGISDVHLLRRFIAERDDPATPAANEKARGNEG